MIARARQSLGEMTPVRRDDGAGKRMRAGRDDRRAGCDERGPGCPDSLETGRCSGLDQHEDAAAGLPELREKRIGVGLAYLRQCVGSNDDVGRWQIARDGRREVRRRFVRQWRGPRPARLLLPLVAAAHAIQTLAEARSAEPRYAEFARSSGR